MGNISNINAYIMTGGDSRRMKTNKSLIQLNGKSLTEHIHRNLINTFKNIYIVGKKNNFQQYNFVEDIEPIQCPLNGIITALEHSKNDWIFVIACDMPLLKSKIINHIFDQIDENSQVVLPSIKKRLQPLCAFYNKTALTHLITQINLGKYSLVSSFDQLAIKEIPIIDKDLVHFSNVNYPDDLDNVSKLLMV